MHLRVAGHHDTLCGLLIPTAPWGNYPATTSVDEVTCLPRLDEAARQTVAGIPPAAPTSTRRPDMPKIHLEWETTVADATTIDEAALRAALVALDGDDPAGWAVLDAAALRNVHEDGMDFETVLSDREDGTFVEASERHLQAVVIDGWQLYFAGTGWHVTHDGL